MYFTLHWSTEWNALSLDVPVCTEQPHLKCKFSNIGKNEKPEDILEI